MTAATTMTPQKWLEAADAQWGRKLRSVSLATEVTVPPHLLEKAAMALGLVHQTAPHTVERLLRTRPAAVVLTFTGAATTVYQGGEFWPGFWATCGIRPTPQDQALWGKSFLAALSSLGLPCFPDLPMRYLGPILMHTGIPDYCLPDYFSVLEQAMRRVGSDAESIVGWVIPRIDTALTNIDVPVRRFFQYGGEYAVDFVDRSLDLMIRVSADDSVDDVQLPERIIEGARHFLGTERGNVGRGAFQHARNRSLRATIRLQPYAGQLLLSLPAIDEVDLHHSWSISADGNTSLVSPRPELGGRRIGLQAHAWPISQPVRRLSVTAPGRPGAQDFALVDEKDPVLFFDEDGALLAAHLSLPPENVWALIGNSGTARDEAFEARILQEEQSPLGWAGWRLVLVDLRDAPSISIGAGLPRHPVRNQTRATLESSEVLTWVTAAGLPLHTARPQVHLPDNIDSSWSLTVTDLDTARRVIQRSVVSTANLHDFLDPFDGLPAPVVGRFEIAVRGPLGRGLNRTIAIAEGLELSPSTAWRSFGRLGLTSCEFDIAGRGLEVAPGHAVIAGDQVAESVQVVGGTGRLQLSLAPPSMAVALTREGIAGRWTNGFVRITIEEIDGTTLVVRVPSEIGRAPLHVVSAGAAVQEIAPDHSSSDGYLRFRLAAMAGTARELTTCELMIDVRGSRVRAALVQPAAIASGIRAEAATLILDDFSGGDVALRVWAVHEPWQPPADLVVDPEGKAVLPDRLAGAGTLCTSWSRVDPWLPTEWNWLPERGNYRIIERDPDPETASTAARALALEIDSDEKLSADKAWPLLAMRYRLPQTLLPWPTVQSLTRGVAQERRDALISLLACPASPAEQAKMLIQSGVVSQLDTSPTAPRQLDPALDEFLQFAITTNPLVGALLAIPTLIDPASVAMLPNAWEAARHTYGDEFVSILAGTGDPKPKAGGFAGASVLDRMAAQQFNDLLASLRVVPKALLDKDSRFKAGLALFESRGRDSMTHVGRDGRLRIEAMNAILRDWHFTEALAVIAARSDEGHRGGWQSLSAQSIGFALIGRVAVRGEAFATQFIDEHLKHWLLIAEVAPELTSIDLVLASAMTASLTAHEHPTFADQAANDREDS